MSADDGDPNLVMEGRLDKFSMEEVFEAVQMGRRSMRLDVFAGSSGAWVKIWFRAGRLQHGESSTKAVGLDAFLDLRKGEWIRYALHLDQAHAGREAIGTLSTLLQEHAPGSITPLHLNGSIETVQMPLFLSTVAESRTGMELRIYDGLHTGSILVRSGEVLAASYGTLTGVQAIIAILATRKGNYKLERNTRTPSTPPLGPLKDLLLELPHETPVPRTRAGVGNPTPAGTSPRAHGRQLLDVDPAPLEIIKPAATQEPTVPTTAPAIMASVAWSDLPQQSSEDDVPLEMPQQIVRQSPFELAYVIPLGVMIILQTLTLAAVLALLVLEWLA